MTLTTEQPVVPQGRVLMFPRFAARIAERGVTQADLAEAVGCARSTIGAIARGSIIPSRALRGRLAVALESEEDELFALHPAVERLLAQAETQGVARGAADGETLRRIATLANAPAGSAEPVEH